MLLGIALAGGAPAWADAPAPAAAAADSLRSTLRAALTSQEPVEAVLARLHRDPRFPVLDRALAGRPLRDQVAALGLVATALSEHDLFRREPRAVYHALRRELEHAMRPVERDGLGLGDKIAHAATRLETAPEVEGMMDAFDVGRFSLFYYEGASDMYARSAKSWAQRGILAQHIAKTGDIGYALRVIDGRFTTATDAREIAHLAGRVFDKWVARTLPLDTAALHEATARSIEDLRGNGTLELFTRLALRADTPAEDRARLLGAVAEQLRDLPQLLEDSEHQRAPETRREISARLWRAFAGTGLAERYPSWGAEYALQQKDAGLTRRLLATPSGKAALMNEVTARGRDFVRSFHELGIALDHDTERAFFAAVLAHGPAPFRSNVYGHEAAGSKLSEAFFEALAKHQDLAAHPNAQAFLLSHLDGVHGDYQRLVIERARGSRGLYEYIPADYVRSTMDRVEHLVQIAPAFGKDAFHAVTRDVFFGREWTRDPHGTEAHHVRRMIGRFLRHADEMGHHHDTDPSLRRALLHDREVLAPLYTAMGEKDRFHDGWGDQRSKRALFQAEIRAAIRKGLPQAPRPGAKIAK